MPTNPKNLGRQRRLVVVRRHGTALILALLSLLLPANTWPSEEPAAPEGVPIAPSPPRSPAEQILAPIPSQFGWMQRDVRSNPLLESLLQLTDRPPQLLMSVSLTEEYSDNFFLSQDDRQEEFRTGLEIGTVYRLEGGRSFLTLANSLGINYEVRADRVNLPFVNLALNTGYQFPRLSLSLSESFIRSDDVQEASPTGLRGERRIFFRNSVSPQLRYDLLRTTAMTLGYTNTVVQEQGNSRSNSDANADGSDNSLSHSVSSGLQHWFTRNVSGSVGYAFATIDSDQTGTRQSHSCSADLSYLVSARTTASVRSFATFTDRSEGEPDSRFYGLTLGLQRQLTPYLSAYVAVGPALLDREGQAKRLIPYWEAAINGGFPLTRLTTLRVSTSQTISNTAGDIDDVGLVLSQSASATLSHFISRSLIAELFGSYYRTELLESSSVGSTDQGEKFSFWSIGGGMSYAFTQALSLNVTYRYRERDAEDTAGRQSDDRFGENYRENRVMLTLSAAFRLL
jgi:opacity protein-like surface antigen